MKIWTKLVVILILFIFQKVLTFDSSLVERTVWNNPSPGYLFLAPMDGNDLSVYDNSGYKVFSKSFGLLSQGFVDFKMHPNGKLSAFHFSIGKFIVLDSNFNIIDTVGAVGYRTDSHEFLILPNGNYVLIAEADTIIDMSRIVPNGHPYCTVNNFIIQEIHSRSKQVVWSWSALDHYSITDATEDIALDGSYIRPFHINSIELLSDGNLLISCRHLDELTKINRQTGAILWRLGGRKCRNNQFTFLNDTIDNFYGFSHQHTPKELSNGNILLFDNGNLRSNRFSRVVEYEIDVANRTARKVWEYRAPNNVVSQAMGSCQRLPNGNTLITWGGTTSEGGHNYLLSEVTPNGTLALEFTANCGTYRGFRYLFKSDAVTNSISSTGVINFRNSQYNTNLSFVVSNLNGTAKYTVEKHRYPPHKLNRGGPCSVIPYRWVITKETTNSIAGYLYFDLNGLTGFSDPSDLKVYYRPEEGFEIFTQLSTTYNSQYNRLETTFSGVGEYCIGTGMIRVPKPLYPDKNAINIPISPRLIWNKFISGEKYRLQVAFNSNFQNILYEFENISDTSYTLNNLLPGKQYYWRVRAERDNCISDWTEPMGFTTIYEKITVFSPSDSSVDMPLKVQFTWAPNSNAWSYQLQIATDKNFERIVKDTVINNSIVEIAGLDYYTEYFWRVRLLRGEQFGMWSDFRKFTTKLASPKLLSPDNNAKSIPFDGEMKWSSVPGAIHYHLVVSKSNQFTKNLIDIVDLKEARYVFSNLEPSTKYYWRVRANGETGKSEWSETYSFITQLPKPELLRPPFADTIAPITGILRWKEVVHANRYEVQICETEQFDIGVITYNVVGQTFVQYSNLAYSTKYYWRVSALNTETESPWSNVFWFKTIPDNYLPPPILIYPDDQKINVTQKDNLKWNSIENAQGYQIQISIDRYFSNVVVDRNLTDTSFSVAGLAYGTRYYWRVRAINNNFNSFWSEILSFTTGLREPTLYSPVSNTYFDALPIEFEWEKTTAKAFYELQIAYDANFEFILTKQILYEQSNYTLTSAPFETWFYWRVRTFSGVLESEWSQVRQFRIKNINFVPEDNSIINFTEIQPNFFLLQFNEQVEAVSVFNLIGVGVYQSTISQSHFLIDLSNYPNGIYFIKFQSKDKSYLFKFINFR